MWERKKGKLLQKKIVLFTFPEASKSYQITKILLMKSNALPTVYFSLHAYTSMHSSSPARSGRSVSPYLRAILSAKGGNSSVSKFHDDDRLAAIRYIKESRTRMK